MSDLGASDLRFLNLVVALLGGEHEGVARALSGIDVERFRRWCLRQQLGGHAYLLLEEMALAAPVPPELLSGLRGAYLEQWARTERLRLGLRELAEMLRAEGESFLVLKGLPFAERYYGAYDRRATGDLDVWVPRERAHEVARRSSDAASCANRRATTPHRRRSSTFIRSSSTWAASASSCTTRCACTAPSASTMRGSGSSGRRWRCTARSTRLLRTSTPCSSICSASTPTSRSARPTRVGSPTCSGSCSESSRRSRGRASSRARDDDGTGKICVNSLALFLVLTRTDERFPALSIALEKRRADIVPPPARTSGQLAPDRLAYLDLLRGASMLERKLWPLRQYEEGTAAAVAWWLAGMPRRIAAKPDAFARDVSAVARGSVPWETTAIESERSALENEFGVDPATFQETFLRFGSLGVLVRYQNAEHLDAVEELFRLRPRQVGEPAPPPADTAGANRGDLVLHVFALGPEQLALLRVPSQAVVRRPLERMVEIHDGIAHLWVREPVRGPIRARGFSPARPSSRSIAIARRARCCCTR